QSRPPPMKGNIEGVWTQREVEAVGERPREPQSDSFGIAAVTTGRDFRATTRRVPRRLRPFNRGVIGRHAPENTRVGSKKVLCAPPYEQPASAQRAFDEFDGSAGVALSCVNSAAPRTPACGFPSIGAPEP